MKILKDKRIRLPLQFFAEGAEGGGAEGEGAAHSGDEGIDNDDLFMAEMEQKYGVTNGVASAQATAKVKAARGDALPKEASEDDGAENVAKDPKEAEPEIGKSAEEEFEELIKSDRFKDVYGKKVASTISDRLKTHEKKKADSDSALEALSLFAAKYGKESTDYKGIAEAIKADESLLEEEAYAAGKTVAELKTERTHAAEKNASEKEISSLKSELETYKNREAARADAEKWMAEAKETQKLYPGFDLRNELKNDSFMKYLRRDGMSVTEAYEHAHLKEIMASQLAAAEKRADENAAKAVAKNRGRVVENANAYKHGNESPRIDVRNMSDDEFNEIEERLARGETIGLDYFT